MNRWRSRPLVCFTLALVLFQLVPVTVAQEAGQRWTGRIDEIINGPNYRQAHWGVLVIDSKTGEVVYSQNADRLFLPASVTKIFSVAAALFLLGADFIFQSPVHRRGEVIKGVLRGDLILVAQGDPTMGGRTDKDGKLAFKNQDHTYAGNGSTIDCLTDTDPLAGLKGLARQIRESGIREVAGDVLIDDRLFDRINSTGSGPTSVSPIIINDNVVDIIIAPGAKAGDAAKISVRPETSYLRMDAVVTTVEKKGPTALTVRAEGSERITVRGTIALGAKPQVRIYGVEDPAAYARCLFIETLRKEGVKVNANPLQAPRGQLPDKESYAKLPRVAEHKSPPLSEVAKVTLKVSHNLYASTLPMIVAAKSGKRTLADGLKLQRDFLAKQGVDVKTISFGGGAGGATADQVTPRAAVQLLQALSKRPDYQAFEDALPVIGVDGTLADVVGAKSPVRGLVKAKSGTLLWIDLLNGRTLLTSKALAGTMTTRTGRRLTFAMFVNNVPLPPGVTSAREGRVLGQLCEVLHDHAP